MTRRRFSLASAHEAAERDELALWVGDFLASRGSDNAILAAALAQDEHWWIGPIEVPLADLERLAGPEDDVLVEIEPDEWEHDVEQMEESVEQGWEPPPLLVEYQDGRLLLQDGNHRYEALTRAGESHAWVIVWFDDPAERDRFAAALPPAR
jgi:ParB-like nuclease family protein